MRMAAIDALHFFGEIPDHPGDVVSVAVIESPNGSSSFAEIRRVIAARAERIPALRELVRTVPLNLDYPHWVRDTEPVERLILEHPANEWPDVLAAITELSLDGVDAVKTGWRLVVFRNVTGAPGIDGRATVVMHQAHPAITAEIGSSHVMRALFGDDDAAAFPGHGNPSEKVGLGAVLQGLRRLPRDIRTAVQASSAGKRLNQMNNAPEPRVSAALNTPGTGRSFVDIRPVPTASLTTLGTVAETTLVAVSVALSKYVVEQGEPAEGLTAILPVAPDSFRTADLPVPAVDTAGARALVSLHSGTADLRERAAKIRADLRDQLVLCESDEVVTVRQGFEATPSFVLALTAGASAKHVPAKPTASVTVTSCDHGPADLSLCGDPVRYIGAAPTLGPRLALTTQVNGLGDRTAVSVAADNSMPNPQRYADLLHEAIAALTA